MRIFGKFADINGKMITVDILTNGDHAEKTGQDTEEEGKRKLQDKYKMTGQSVYEGAAEFEANQIFPTFRRAKEFDRLDFPDDFEEPLPDNPDPEPEQIDGYKVVFFNSGTADQDKFSVRYFQNYTAPQAEGGAVVVESLDPNINYTEYDNAGEDAIPAHNWDTQFLISLPEPLAEGTNAKLVMKVKADKAATAETQSHKAIPAPGAIIGKNGYEGTFLHYSLMGNIYFTTEWTKIEKDFTVPNQGDGMQSICLNLQVLKETNKYYFDDITVYVEKGLEPDEEDEPDVPTPHDNLDVSILPPIVPDTEPEDDYGSKTDVQTGHTWYGENADYTIGEDGLWFADSPFEITSEVEDNFDHIIKQTAVLRLVTSKYVGHLLFSAKMRKSRIIVQREGNTVFDGYLTMNVYNQPFNTDADVFEVQCVDKLSTINFFNYKKTFPETYKANKGNATVVSFKNVLLDALSGLDGNIFYDCSKSIDGSRWTTVFDDIGIGENVFFGDDFDGMMNREETLTEILQYLNLHIVQHKEDFYIFDWNTIKKGQDNWICLSDSNIEDTTSGTAKILSGDMHMAMDTDITIADVYSQVQVTCDVDEAEEILADMFETDDLKSYFNNYQMYMTEYISEGKGQSAQGCFRDMINGIANDYDAGSMVDWYVQAMYNENWTLNPNSPEQYEKSEGGRYINQHLVADNVKNNSLRAGFFRIGKVERKATELQKVDPVPRLDTKDYLYISVNGNEEKEQSLMRPTDAQIAAAEPIIEYTGNTATGSFSPVDKDTTNYLVFEGKIELQPIQKESTVYGVGTFIGNIPTTVPSENNDDGRFYARKWYKYFDCYQQEPTTEGWSTPNVWPMKLRPNDHYVGAGLMMPAKDKSFDTAKVDKHEDPFRYSYSADGDSTDQIRKVPVLECYLKIGNKILVEYNFKKDGSSDFGWFTEDDLPYVEIDGRKQTAKASTFTIGFNPSIGDVILGTEFPIQNTISFTMNIDGNGTSVPIKKDDALSGDIDFKILGPCTLVWNQVIRIHPSFWRSTSWERDALPTLAFTENIILSDFSIRVESDNALDNNEGNDNDLMYVAQETDYNFNTKREVDFKVITQLDAETAKAKGIKNGIYLNATVNMTNNEPLDCLYTKKEGKKRAEEHYVYDYLEDWRKSRITLSMTVKDDDIDFRDRFGSVPLKKSFNILGISRNVKLDTATLLMREYADGLSDFSQTS